MESGVPDKNNKRPFKNMPKLIQINTTLNSGSTGRIAEQIALLAESRGWKCYIAHGARYVNPSQIESLQVGTKLGNIFHAVIGELMGLHGFGSTIATYNLIRKIKKINPDVIHLHNIHGYYLNIKVLFDFLAETNIPVVWTLHDCWSFTGHCTHFENGGCYKWKTECGNCPLLMAQYKSRWVDRSRENFLIKKKLYAKLQNLTIVPVSFWLGNLVTESILQDHVIRVIRNGIDLSVFRSVQNDVRVRYGIPDNKKIILGVVASGFKGKREFIELSKISDYQVVVVGVRKEWISSLPDGMICIGRTNSQSELAEYYSAADVFVNPTEDESLGLTNIEAIACGTPVVTYKAGGSPETLDDRTGIAVEKGDLDAMKRAINLILSRGKSYYSKSCRERAERYFNKDERFVDYIELYESFVNT